MNDLDDYGRGRRIVSNIETYCGHYLDYLDPHPGQIELEDVARGLSQVCRFAGQTNRYYSVAEHAVYVRSLVIEAGRPDLGLAALHHDSHEAYLGDWPSPLKFVFDSARLRELSAAIDLAICARFAIDYKTLKHPLIKEMDTLAMRREAATLKYSHGVGEHWGFTEPLLSLAGIGWDHDRAEREFLKAHAEESEATVETHVHLPSLLSGVFGISTSEARRCITQGGVFVNDVPVRELDMDRGDLYGSRLRLGKRREVTIGRSFAHWPPIAEEG